MPLTRLILVRHAKSLPDPTQPEPEWPLSDLGRQQAVELVPVLADAGVNRLVSSPYVRAIETLRPFAEAAGCPIEVNPDLRERRLTAAWIDDLEPELARMHSDLAYGWPDGETGPQAPPARRYASRAEALRSARGPPVDSGDEPPINQPTGGSVLRVARGSDPDVA
ncbi:MAG: histidine phosphatase family protein [Alphaproteobacteria bacterium]|nr:histidine phosphatase family protein [Alphaproteobacteria bacterium]